MRAAGEEGAGSVMADIEQKPMKEGRSEKMREEFAALGHLQGWLRLVTQMTMLQTHPHN